jgi:hypothetical protein
VGIRKITREPQTGESRQTISQVVHQPQHQQQHQHQQWKRPQRRHILRSNRYLKAGRQVEQAGQDVCSYIIYYCLLCCVYDMTIADSRAMRRRRGYRGIHQGIV